MNEPGSTRHGCAEAAPFGPLGTVAPVGSAAGMARAFRAACTMQTWIAGALWVSARRPFTPTTDWSELRKHISPDSAKQVLPCTSRAPP